MPHQPHDDVYTKLAPSPIHGVGVFAIRHIPAGTNLFGDDESGLVELDNATVSALPIWAYRLYHNFAIKRYDGMWDCPLSFNDMTVAYYLNHSSLPNCEIDTAYHFYALRDIELGEELTVDYGTFSEQGL